MLAYGLCAVLAPAAASAAAFPWITPEPTVFAPAIDKWSPAPTPGPEIGVAELFRREVGDNTCGFIGGNETSSLTCSGEGQICATNTYYGVHGCCPSSDIDGCNIPTTCIPSSQMSASCNSACQSDSSITKCTDSQNPHCYQWLFIYPRTTMTQYGCGSIPFTSSVMRSPGGVSSSMPSEAAITQTVTQTVQVGDILPTSDPSASPQASQKSKTNIGVIVGGTVGGCVVASTVVIAAIFFIRRRRKQKENATVTIHQPFATHEGPAPGVTEYNPHGFPSPHEYPAAYCGNDKKAWGSQGQEVDPYSVATTPGTQYPGAMGFGAIEIDGGPGRQIYEAPPTRM